MVPLGMNAGLRPRSVSSRSSRSTAAAATPCPVLSRPKPFGPAAQRRVVCRVNEVDLEGAVEAFMKRQAELESGAAFARPRDVGVVIGADVVNEDAAKTYCAEIFEVLRLLKRTRDMSLAEVKLVVSIEDPRTRERRTQGVEDARGVSRDEMAAALLEVAEGRVPRDRIALKCLHEEISGWPFLETPLSPPTPSATSASGAASPSSSPAAAPVATLPSEYHDILAGADTVVRPYIMGQELRKGEQPQGLADMLPAWVGYGSLYGITLIPVMLVVGTVLVLFYSSLK